MASYHCSIKQPLSRAKGKSLMEKAAYNGRTQYRDERTGQSTEDYSERGGHIESYLAHDSKLKLPDWVKDDRQRLLNAAVAAEKRKDSREGQEIVFGFIHELGLQKSKWMLNDFVRENFTRGTGRLAVIDIHDAPDHGDLRNQHAHVILLPREMSPDGSFGKRLPALEPKDYDRIRDKWAEKGAKELRKAGYELEADRYRWGHLQLRHDPEDRRTWNGNNQHDKAIERGDLDWAKHCDREAEKHRGPAADAMERKGQDTDRGQKPEPIWDRDAANRDWESAIIQAAIENEKTGGREKRNTAQQEHSAAPAVTGTAAQLHEARQRSDSPKAFMAALAEHGIDLAQATRADAAQSQLDSAEAKIAGYWKPTFREGEFVAVTDQGQVWKLTERTTGDKDIQKFLKGLDAPLPSIQETKHKKQREQDLEELKPRGRWATGPRRGGMVEQQAWARDRAKAADEYRRNEQDRRQREEATKSTADIDPQRYLTDPDYRRQVRTERSFMTPAERKAEKENNLRALMEQQDRGRG